MPDDFEVRGVVEGYYGTPWPSDARRAVLSTLARHGMNAYVYAPKDDPYHRAEWRTPYPPSQAADLRDLAEHCHSVGLRFGFAISPGLDIDPGSRADREALAAKLNPFREAGVDWFVLAFDDLPDDGTGDGAARARQHVDLVRDVLDRAPGSTVTVVPTDYVGTHPTPYLEVLADTLPSGVDVMWTGRSVVPARITADEARARARALGGRPPLIWDNYPVNDAVMAPSLHLGPLRGRDPELARHCRGFLFNPMAFPHASLVPLLTAAAFTTDPTGYEPDAAWSTAIDIAGGDDAGALRALAHACAASALTAPSDVPLHRALDRLDAGAPDAEAAVRAELEAAAALDGALTGPLGTEVADWARQAAREARLGLDALALVSGPGRASGWAGSIAHLGVLAAWGTLRRAQRVVFGPRFAIYPALTQDAEGALVVDAEEAYVEDQSAIDRLCRRAFRGGPSA